MAFHLLVHYPGESVWDVFNLSDSEALLSRNIFIEKRFYHWMEFV